jgi:hypothetical protein
MNSGKHILTLSFSVFEPNSDIDRFLRLRDTPIWKLESGIPVQVMPRALHAGVTDDQAHERAPDRALRKGSSG